MEGFSLKDSGQKVNSRVRVKEAEFTHAEVHLHTQSLEVEPVAAPTPAGHGVFTHKMKKFMNQDITVISA